MVSAVLTRTFERFGALFAPLVAWSAAIIVPTQAVLLALQLSAPETDRTRNGLLAIDLVLSVLIVTPIVTVIAVRAVLAGERGEKRSSRRDLLDALDLLPAFFLAQLLVLIAIAALPLLVVGAGLALGAPFVVLLGLGFLIASGVVQGTRLMLVVPVLVVEGLRGGAALRRSVTLVQGAWLRVFLTLVVGAVIVLVPASIVQGILHAALEDTSVALAERLGSALVGVVTTPLIALFLLAVLRERVQATGASPQGPRPE